MGSLGPFEIIAILLVILLLFGAKRIPEIARGLGKGIREFKDATNDIKQELTVTDQRPQIQQPRPTVHQAQPSQPAAMESTPPPLPNEPPPADGQAPETQS